ncbi:hypothetical protein GCM10025734_34000 [Kitasatospora paranensis]
MPGRGAPADGGAGTVEGVSENDEQAARDDRVRHDRLGEKLPIRMLHDRVLVRTEAGEGSAVRPAAS